MSERLKHFEEFKMHPWLTKVYTRLSIQELELARSFIAQHDQLGKGDFEYKINRMFLHDDTKPKHFKEILELLTCANSSCE